MKAAMVIHSRIFEFIKSTSGSILNAIVEAVRYVVGGDPELRRRVSFSVAIIALSAKMAKADGVVTPNEIRAFHEIFSVPPREMGNVTRLYDLARQDVAGYEAYAQQMAALCDNENGDCSLLEDILDGLFHIATADGILHDREEKFLHRVAEVFGVSETRFSYIRARHAGAAGSDPYLLLGVHPDMPFTQIKRRYRELVKENHPDRLIARGVPIEFLAIANTRLAAINGAFSEIEKSFMPA